MKYFKLLIVFLFTFSINSYAQFCSDVDKDNLEQIWLDLNSPSLSNWDFTPGVELTSSWQGITMTGDGCNIRNFNLNSLGLTGTLAPEFGNLTELNTLFLFDNAIEGTIPPELGDLDNLFIMNLASNQLEGTIPTELGDLNSVIDIYLSENLLEGSIPLNIENIGSLSVLSLGSNFLDGTIPDFLGNMTNLSSLSLNNNEFTGPIPSNFGNLINLNTLALQNNQLTGTIPTSLGSLSNLLRLYLHNNQLEGNIPDQLGFLTGLDQLFMQDNDLSGCIPVTFHQLCSSGTSVSYFNNPNLLNDNFGSFCTLNLGDCELDPSFDFVTTWQTDIDFPGSTGNTSIKIPVFPTEMYDFTIDWDDNGPIPPVNISGLGSAIENDLEFDYLTAGTYTVRISGDFPRIYFDNSGDRHKIQEINQWGAIPWSSMESAFYGCVNLLGLANDVPDLTNVEDMGNMFRRALLFNQNISNWDVSNVTLMNGVFREADAFNQPIISWDVSNVTDMSHMFRDAISFNQSLDSWATANVTTMNSMFRDAISFNGQVNGNQNIDSWNVSQVTNFHSMFKNAIAFNDLIGVWNVSSADDMSEMFNDAIAFNRPLANWNVVNVTTMNRMFYNATMFNQDIGNWNTQSVSDMSWMFRNATDFDQDIGDWNISSLTNAGLMFFESELSVGNYDNLLCGWASQPIINSGVSFHGGSSFYCSCEAARQDLDIINSWTIVDGGLQCSPSLDDFVITINTQLAGSMNATFTIPTAMGETYGYYVDWDNNGSFLDPIQTGDNMHTFDIPGVYTIRIKGLFPRILFDGSNQQAMIISVDQWGNNPWTSMSKAFAACGNLHINASDAPNLSNVLDMESMFSGASVMNEDIGFWDVSNVQYMNGLFSGASLFNQDISGWDVGNVSVMFSMFQNATSFNKNISAWNMTSASNLNNMFRGATAFDQPLADWSLTLVAPQNLQSMFRGATTFDQNIGSWPVQNVAFADDMFLDAELSIDNYDALLIGWAPQLVLNGVTFHGGDSKYCAGANAREYLTIIEQWSIVDGGEGADCPSSPCHADFNFDGIVDGDDFSIFLGNFGFMCDPYCPTDLDDNGITDGPDFSIFLGNYGLTCNY